MFIRKIAQQHKQNILNTIEFDLLSVIEVLIEDHEHRLVTKCIIKNSLTIYIF